RRQPMQTKLFHAASALVSLTRPSIVALLLAVDAPPSFADSTYDDELRPDLNGLPISVEMQPFHCRLVLKLTNGRVIQVRCSLRNDASPQPMRHSSLYFSSGETAENSFRAARKWFSVTVGVTCKPAEK